MSFCGELSKSFPNESRIAAFNSCILPLLFLLQIAMVSAWFMDSSDEDQRLSHQLDPPQPVSLEDLANCGVLYWKVSFFSLIYTLGRIMCMRKKL